MFRPRPGGYHNREENEAPAPKKHAAVYASPDKIREILAVIQVEVPTLALSEKNVEKVFHWLWEEDAVGGFTLENVRVAVAALSYPKDTLEGVIPPPPPPPPPPVVEPEPEEVLLPGQLSLKCDKWDLEHASKEQVTDWLKRARAAGMR